MLTTQPVDYDELQTALSRAGLALNAAEVHGVMCGSMCNQMKTGISPDIQQLLTAGAEVSEESLAPLRDLLESLLQETANSLYRNLSEFDLLLPDDSESLSLRLQALADWCRGFMIGLLNKESFAIDQLSQDSAEVARDIIAVSEAEATQGEDSEWDLAEVEEYVRVGVQLIFEEMCAGQENSMSGEIH